jgi:hypothetical protein
MNYLLAIAIYPLSETISSKHITHKELQIAPRNQGNDRLG